QFFNRSRRCLDTGTFWHPYLDQNFGAIGRGKELLFDGTHADNRERHQYTHDRAGHEFMTNGKLDCVPQATVVWRIVDCVMSA
ncbi:hypothetical protein SCB29_40365, partial [Paraburkholderia sp. SIMBA_055]